MTDSWAWAELIKTFVADEAEKKKTFYAHGVLPEFVRLESQRCAYCSGYGHAGKDCPTDFKIARMRGGVRE